MKLLLQRVQEASVRVDQAIIGAIGPGLLIFVCGEPDDTDDDVIWLAGKVAKMRIFKDEDAKMNRSILDVGGAALVISQFTLIADWRRGNRPGFSKAAPPEQGNRLYESFKAALTAQGLAVESGEFGADMAVTLINDGPVTIWMDSRD